MGILVAGMVGLGAVWGWLAAQRIPASRHPWRSLLTIPLATLLLTALGLWVADRWAVMLFLGAAGISFLLYLLWFRMLQARFRAI